MAAREIVFFETDSGRSPVAEYIEDLHSSADRAAIVKVLEMVAENEVVPVHFLKKMHGRGELWEVRARQHRIFCFHTRAHGTGPRELVLVSAFPKQSQKTRGQEMEVALRRRDTYLSRRGDPK